MKIIRSVFFVLAISLLFGYSEVSEQYHYTSLSRFTNAGEYEFMLNDLPDNAFEICDIVKNLTIHYNLQYFLGKENMSQMPKANVWSPDFSEFLQCVYENPPGNIHEYRNAKEKICGCCVKDAYLLAGILRYKQKKARVRVGFFKDIRKDTVQVMKFWDKVSETKAELFKYSDAETKEWMKINRDITRKQNINNHYIEHWVCEYWNEEKKSWMILDPQNEFLKHHSGIDIGYNLPYHHFEFAYQSWIAMRNDKNYNDEQYSESSQDGR